METKVLQVFYGKDCLPYKDKERSVHFPIIGAAIQGASNTTKIRFYFDELVEEDDQTTTWVVVSKLPNGKIGSEIVETALDSELNEHYALFNLKNFYTQAKGDLFLSLQGYQGGVQVETDPSTGISQIIGTPTIQATGSIKLAINYATQLVGSGETANINFQKILADLGTKLGIRAYTERVAELPTTGQTNVFYAIYDEPNNQNKLNIYVWNGTKQSYVWVGDNTLYLGDYYTQEQGDQFESDINNRVTSVENELSSVASGSPKGVYETLSDLETAYPTGTTGIYVVQADGHWYYWNGSAWTDGGVYQATEISDIVFSMFSSYLQSNLFYNIEATFPSTITDMNDIPYNKGYGITVDTTELTLANCPYYPFQGAIRDFTVFISNDILRLQVVQSPTGEIYYRCKWVSWTNWQQFINKEYVDYKDDTLKYNCIVSSEELPNTITNLNETTIINKIYRQTSDKTELQLANCPYYPFQGVITTIASGIERSICLLQIVQSPTGEIYYRTKWASWTNWSKITKETDVDEKLSTRLSLIDTNATDILNGYFVSRVDGELIQHSDYKTLVCNVNGAKSINYKYTVAELDYTALAFYDANDNFISSFRALTTEQTITIPSNAVICRATISDANQVIINANISDVLAEIDNKEKGLNIFSAFSNITCIGDSLTVGAVYTDASSENVRLAYNPYPVCLQKRTGTQTYTLAQGGYTAMDWWNAFANNLQQRTNQLAIIYLGTNGGLTDTLSTDISDPDYNNWANTNTGCYCKIIMKCYSLGMKVLLIKPWVTSGDMGIDVTNNVIDKIGIQFGCAVVNKINLTDLKYHYYPDRTGYNDVHYNDLGYCAFTDMLIKKTGDLGDDQMKWIIPN